MVIKNKHIKKLPTFISLFILTCTIFNFVIVANLSSGGSFYDNAGAINGQDIILSSGPWIDVRAYGATGNGSTDDTTFIQKAANVAGGKTLLFPQPSVSYKVTGLITLPNSCRVLGVGLSTIYQATANATTFLPGNDNEIAFLKFTGTGNFSVAGRGAISNDINNTGTIGARVNIHDNFFDSSLSTSAISGVNWIASVIERNVINVGAQGEHGIYISGGAPGSSDTKIINNVITSTATSVASSNRGIQIKGAKRIWVEGNTVTGSFSGYGIVSSDSSSDSLYIRRNRVYSLASGVDCISVGSNDTDTNVFIEDNTVDSCSNGIHVVGANAINNVFVRRNTVTNGTAKGVFLDGTGNVATNLIVDENIVEGNTGDGINSTACGNPLFIRYNFITGSSASAGISIPSGSTQGLVAYNTAVGYSTPVSIITTIPVTKNQTSLTVAP